MSNGRTELDREGCEYGRSLKKDNEYLQKDVEEIKKDLKTIIQKVDQLRSRLDKSNIFTIIGATVVGTINGWFSSHIGGGS